jgi:enamine deaminase RidA (YjgF/YER057c/UK114 family)
MCQASPRCEIGHSTATCRAARCPRRTRCGYHPGEPPANTLLVVAGLADPRYLVEIDAIAVLPDLPDT